MHEILQTLSLAVTSIPSVACVVAANCPKPMAALEVFPTLPSWFQFTESQNTYCTTPVCAEFFRVLATSNALQLIDLSSYGSPPLPPRNHLQLDLEFPEKNAGELFRQMKIWKIMDDFMKHQKKQENMIAEQQYHNFCHNFCKLNGFFTSLVTANALNILDWLHDPLQQCDSVLLVGSFPVGCQIATNKMMQNSVQTTMV